MHLSKHNWRTKPYLNGGCLRVVKYLTTDLHKSVKEKRNILKNSRTKNISANEGSALFGELLKRCNIKNCFKLFGKRMQE